MAIIDIQNTLRFQSPYLYCQTASSDGSDGSKPGAHLRWDLMKELGKQHLPKGNLADPNVPFNKANDFVSIYRCLCLTDRMMTIDFTNIDLTMLTVLPNDEGISYRVNYIWGSNDIIAKFTDRAQYHTIMQQGLDPNNPLQDFLNRYTGMIEVSVKDKLLMSYNCACDPNGSYGDAWVETVATTDRYNDSVDSKLVIHRYYYDYNSLMNGDLTIEGENIAYIRLQQNTMPAPYILSLLTYEDVFDTIQVKQGWDHIGDFSLSLNDTEVFTRFQGTPYTSGTPQLQWRKYNDGAELVPANYADRWLNTDGGLKSIVQQYISLSNYDAYANVNLPSSDPNDPNSVTVSLLDTLRLISLDYHAARMLGLGYIDEEATTIQGRLVYAALYRTYENLPEIGTINDHVYLTMATGPQRLPASPILNPVTYGLNVATDENATPVALSDTQGYSFYDDTRFVNLSKINRWAPQPLQPAIPMDDDVFDATQFTQPASFGIEYRLQGQTSWQNPELLHDDEYVDQNNNLETVTTPEHEGSTLYTHRETSPGIHEYAIYAVNWFSRISPLSNIIATDNTVFPKRNTLLPPFNLAVQYLQEEDPLIFTTQTEQNALEAANLANPTGDNYKTRVTFDWDNLHNNAYQFANKVEFFYRDAPIMKVEGQVKSVSSISDYNSLITTTSYQMASVNPAVNITPQIAPGTEGKFIGSLLNTAAGQFEVLSIMQSTIPGDGPSFIVKNLVTMEAVQANDDDPYISVPRYTPPDAGSVFFLFENILGPGSWAQLTKTVDIVKFSSTTETVYEEDGSSHVEVVGGINSGAVVQEITGSGGGYTISFPTGVDLDPHPDTDVTWIKGSARFPLLSDPQKKKRLPVISIQQTSPIQLVVFDPEYYTLPAENIMTGGNVDVNYHPSYKVYLSPQAGVFDKTKTLPAGQANNKKTYLAARSVDTTQSLHSPLTPPAILVARNIQKPVKPQDMQGPDFATRPDFYGKSTYTLDVKLDTNNRSPFGLMVYRANEMAILQALYKPATLTGVLAGLASFADFDPFAFNRWNSLMEVETELDDDRSFRTYGSYAFPAPDNDSTELFITATASIHPFPLQTGQTLVTQKAMIKKVIEDVFTPLTETPIIFSYLKTGYQTSAKEPTTKSVIGRLLDPADTSFDPFPMAVKFPLTNPDSVRFTDYTINGNSRNIYFYFAREISLSAQLSERTAVSKPVMLVDAAPAEKPRIRKIVSNEANALLSQPPSVQFDLAEYIDAENIRQFQVFRATSLGDAATIQSMKLATTIDAGNAVQDTFSDLSFPPYGQPLFYRVVALRAIVNEQGDREMVPSQPSEMVLTNIIDVNNPEAPEITAAIDSLSYDQDGNVFALEFVTLSWAPTTYNGTYTLYKMNDKGNWVPLWSTKTNDALIQYPQNGDWVTWDATNELFKQDEEGNVIYHRFKVTVQNASGLLNLEDKVLVL